MDADKPTSSIPIADSSHSSPSSSSSNQGDNESVIIDEFEYQYKEEKANNEATLNVETGEIHHQSSTESVSASASPPPSSDKDKTQLDTSNDDNLRNDDDGFLPHPTHSRSISASSNDGWIDVHKDKNEPNLVEHESGALAAHNGN